MHTLYRRYLIEVAELQQHSYDAVRLSGEARSLYPQILPRGIDSEPGPAAKPSTPMKHGRIVRVSERQGYTTYIVAEEDAAKAVALIEKAPGPDRSYSQSAVLR